MKKALALMLVLTLSLSLLAGCGGSPAASPAPDSGAQAAVCLAQSGTRHLLLGHLSSENNTPDLAYRTTHAALTNAGACVGGDVTLHVAARYRASYLYTMA